MKQKFTHDCTFCRFVGHFHKFDIHICTNAIPRATILARFGNDSAEYASIPLESFKERIAEDFSAMDTRVNAIVVGQPLDYQVAMLMGLAHDAIERMPT